jgi:hypothetical protein
MSSETMTAFTLQNFRAGLRQAIRRIFPRNGFFDTIFYSYDDWRELQEEGKAKAGEKEPEK